MCGICGVYNFDDKPVTGRELTTMMQRMRHRGPDDKGSFLDGNVGLGHMRLSILDLSSAGKQPMFSADGRYALIYNGEIYNFVELKKQLDGKVAFKTGTDTEVLLAVLQEWGIEGLHRCNGMWALALYDLREKRLFLTRDRYGVKPLYYYRDQDTFIFASEIKALLPLLPVSPSINERIMFEYLVYNRTDQSTDTFVSEIKRVQHGGMIEVDKSGAQIGRWYELTERLGQPWQSPSEFRETFSSAVGIRLRSDVPVGVCLSGGLDSSSVTSCVVDDHQRPDLYTFSAVYGEGEQGDEKPYIDEYKDTLTNLKYVYPTSDTFYDDFEPFLDCHFEPLHHLSIYSQFKVLKEARRDVTVLLDGQGADEQLGGYHYFFSSYFRELLRNLHFVKALSQIYYYVREHRSAFALSYLAFYSIPNQAKNFVSSQKAGWLASDFYRDNQGVSRLNEQLFDPSNLVESLLQHFEYKLEHNLKWNDLNSMYFSLELREPFLDYRIVERTLSSPSRHLIRDGYTKWILREAMKDTLPESIRLRQDKVGFDNPSDEWFREPKFVTMVQDILNSKELQDCGYLDLKECRRRYDDHLQNKINITKDIWKWVNLYYFLNALNSL